MDGGPAPVTAVTAHWAPFGAVKEKVIIIFKAKGIKITFIGPY